MARRRAPPCLVLPLLLTPLRRIRPHRPPPPPLRRPLGDRAIESRPMLPRTLEASTAVLRLREGRRRRQRRLGWARRRVLPRRRRAVLRTRPASSSRSSGGGPGRRCCRPRPRCRSLAKYLVRRVPAAEGGAVAKTRGAPRRGAVGARRRASRRRSNSAGRGWR